MVFDDLTVEQAVALHHALLRGVVALSALVVVTEHGLGVIFLRAWFMLGLFAVCVPVSRLPCTASPVPGMIL